MQDIKVQNDNQQKEKLSKINPGAFKNLIYNVRKYKPNKCYYNITTAIYGPDF